MAGFFDDLTPESITQVHSTGVMERQPGIEPPEDSALKNFFDQFAQGVHIGEQAPLFQAITWPGRMINQGVGSAYSWATGRGEGMPFSEQVKQSMNPPPGQESIIPTWQMMALSLPAGIAEHAQHGLQEQMPEVAKYTGAVTAPVAGIAAQMGLDPLVLAPLGALTKLGPGGSALLRSLSAAFAMGAGTQAYESGKEAVNVLMEEGVTPEAVEKATETLAAAGFAGLGAYGAVAGHGAKPGERPVEGERINPPPSTREANWRKLSEEPPPPPSPETTAYVKNALESMTRAMQENMNARAAKRAEPGAEGIPSGPEIAHLQPGQEAPKAKLQFVTEKTRGIPSNYRKALMEGRAVAAWYKGKILIGPELVEHILRADNPAGALDNATWAISHEYAHGMREAEGRPPGAKDILTAEDLAVKNQGRASGHARGEEMQDIPSDVQHIARTQALADIIKSDPRIQNLYNASESMAELRAELRGAARDIISGSFTPEATQIGEAAIGKGAGAGGRKAAPFEHISEKRAAEYRKKAGVEEEKPRELYVKTEKGAPQPERAPKPETKTERRTREDRELEEELNAAEQEEPYKRGNRWTGLDVEERLHIYKQVKEAGGPTPENLAKLGMTPEQWKRFHNTNQFNYLNKKRLGREISAQAEGLYQAGRDPIFNRAYRREGYKPRTGRKVRVRSLGPEAQVVRGLQQEVADMRRQARNATDAGDIAAMEHAGSVAKRVRGYLSRMLGKFSTTGRQHNIEALRQSAEKTSDRIARDIARRQARIAKEAGLKSKAEAEHAELREARKKIKNLTKQVERMKRRGVQEPEVEVPAKPARGKKAKEAPAPPPVKKAKKWPKKKKAEEPEEFFAEQEKPERERRPGAVERLARMREKSVRYGKKLVSKLEGRNRSAAEKAIEVKFKGESIESRVRHLKHAGEEKVQPGFTPRVISRGLREIPQEVIDKMAEEARNLGARKPAVPVNEMKERLRTMFREEARKRTEAKTSKAARFPSKKAPAPARPPIPTKAVDALIESVIARSKRGPSGAPLTADEVYDYYRSINREARTRPLPEKYGGEQVARGSRMKPRRSARKAEEVGEYAKRTAEGGETPYERNTREFLEAKPLEHELYYDYEHPGGIPGAARTRLGLKGPRRVERAGPAIRVAREPETGVKFEQEWRHVKGAQPQAEGLPSAKSMAQVRRSAVPRLRSAEGNLRERLAVKHGGRRAYQSRKLTRAEDIRQLAAAQGKKYTRDQLEALAKEGVDIGSHAILLGEGKNVHPVSLRDIVEGAKRTFSQAKAPRLVEAGAPGARLSPYWKTAARLNRLLDQPIAKSKKGRAAQLKLVQNLVKQLDQASEQHGVGVVEPREIFPGGKIGGKAASHKLTGYGITRHGTVEPMQGKNITLEQIAKASTSEPGFSMKLDGFINGLQQRHLLSAGERSAAYRKAAMDYFRRVKEETSPRAVAEKTLGKAEPEENFAENEAWRSLDEEFTKNIEEGETWEKAGKLYFREGLGQRQRDLYEGVHELARDVGVLKTSMSSADLSNPFRQTLVLTAKAAMQAPGQALHGQMPDIITNFKEMAGSYKKSYYNRVNKALEADKWYKSAQKAGVNLIEKPSEHEFFMGVDVINGWLKGGLEKSWIDPRKWIAEVPEKVIVGAARAFTHYQNLAMRDAFKDGVEFIRQHQGKVTAASARDLADVINVFGTRTPIKNRLIRESGNIVFFSPQMIKSNARFFYHTLMDIGWTQGDALRFVKEAGGKQLAETIKFRNEKDLQAFLETNVIPKDVKVTRLKGKGKLEGMQLGFSRYGTKAVRQWSRRAVGQTIVFGASLLGMGYAIAKAAGLDPEIERDPRSSDFAKLRVGDSTFDPWGGKQQYFRYLVQAGLGKQKLRGSGRVQRVARGDLVSRFIRSKLNPAMGMVWSAMTGTSPEGREVFRTAEGTTRGLLNSTLPLILQDAMDIAKEQPNSYGLFLAAMATLGGGVQAGPGYKGAWKTPELRDVDLRVSKELRARHLEPPRASTRVTLPGRNLAGQRRYYVLSRSEREKFEKQTMPVIMKKLDEFIRSDQYQALSNQQKVRALAVRLRALNKMYSASRRLRQEYRNEEARNEWWTDEEE